MSQGGLGDVHYLLERTWKNSHQNLLFCEKKLYNLWTKKMQKDKKLAKMRKFQCWQIFPAKNQKLLEKKDKKMQKKQQQNHQNKKGQKKGETWNNREPPLPAQTTLGGSFINLGVGCLMPSGGGGIKHS